MASARFSIDSTELAGKRALVTGGTQGVSAAIVSRPVAAGARVATTARSEAPHRDALDLFVRADVGTSEGAHEVAWAVLEQYGGSTSSSTTSADRRLQAVASQP